MSRDLGEHLREQAKILFTVNKSLTLEDPKLEKQVASLEKVTSSVHQKNHPRSLNSTATGLTAEQCNQVLSSEFLEYLNDDSKSSQRK